MTVTADGAGACEQLRQCHRVTGAPLWAPWPIYEQGSAAAPDLSTARPAPRPPRSVRAGAFSRYRTHANPPVSLI